MNRKILTALLAAVLLLPYGCTRKPQDQGKEITSAEFSALTLKWFSEDVAEDPFDLHFSLTHPEKFGITELSTSLGEVEDNGDDSELKERIRTLEEMSLAQLTEYVNRDIVLSILNLRDVLI